MASPGHEDIVGCIIPYPAWAPHVFGCQCHACVGATFTPIGPAIPIVHFETSLSDADVQRIARAVVDLLRSENHDPGDEG